ncbi:NAD(P)H-dependent oxidoreductase [Sphingopyxis sp. 550A]
MSGTALLVHAHSETDSFVTAMRDRIAGRLAADGWRIAHSDLYAMGFNPVLSPADFSARKDSGHLVYALEQRHAYETGTIASDISLEIAKILAADLVIFTFPLFWFGVPAILKGWIDRVFVSGTFYRGRHIYGSGGMAGKRAFAAFSLGGRQHMFGPGSIHGELVTGMLRPFLQGALGYVGFEVIEPFVAYHVPYLSPEGRQEILASLESAVARLDERELLAMPDLAVFDAQFLPLPLT